MSQRMAVPSVLKHLTSGACEIHCSDHCKRQHMLVRLIKSFPLDKNEHFLFCHLPIQLTKSSFFIVCLTSIGLALVKVAKSVCALLQLKKKILFSYTYNSTVSETVVTVLVSIAQLYCYCQLSTDLLSSFTFLPSFQKRFISTIYTWLLLIAIHQFV